jgi:2-amino-4-hydroxy-6-hydroxymethyldihydropteridine diphosphokinase
MPDALNARTALTINTSYIALGSNLANENGDSLAQLQSAVREIHALNECDIIACSPVYRSPAQETITIQPDYLNAVIKVETHIRPEVLLSHLSMIERKHGRTRDATIEENAARTLDLDVLLFNNEAINTKTLTVPHPRMHLRAFVLRPLLDLAPAIVIPRLGEADHFLSAIISIQPITLFSEPLQWM